MPTAASPAPASPAGRRSRSPTIATSPAASTRSPRSRWSKRSARNIGRPISSSIARVLKPGGKAALQLISIRDDLFDRYAANADFIQAYIFPGGMLIGEARFRRIAEQAGLGWHDRDGYGPHYAETLRRWRAALRRGRRRRPPARRLRRRLPRPVALLSDVLRRRLPRRRHRRRPGDADQGLGRAARAGSPVFEIALEQARRSPRRPPPAA